MLWLLLKDAFWSGIAALGFAILFNMPVRALAGCAFCGAVGHTIRTVLLQAGLEIELATLFAALVVGLLGYRFARHWHTPSTVFAITGAIPMVPGTFAYNTMIGLLKLASSAAGADEGLLLETVISAIKTLLIVGALTVGIAAPALLPRRNPPQN